MRLLFACGRELAYVRNQMMLDGLRQHFNTVAITSEAPWGVLRLLQVAGRLGRGYPPCQAALIGFTGHPLMLLSRWLPRPICFDAYISLYDTLCFDRRWLPPRSPLGRLARWVDRAACQQADRVILDTYAHADYFAHTLAVPEEKLRVVYVGCDERHFYPRPAPEAGGAFVVFYYGAFLPLQGIEHIVRAAKLLEGEPGLEFRVGGTGMAYRRVRTLVARWSVTNLRFLGWIPYARLPDHIAGADLCLAGHFGDSAKAQRVIPTKVAQFLAMARPTVAGDTPANRELLAHGETAYLCPVADPQALASAILELKQDAAVRQHIAQEGYRLFAERLNRRAIGQELKIIVEEAVQDARPAH